MDWNLLSLLPLGIAAALAPCPLATNIAATGYIAQNLGSNKQALLAAICYTLGRILAYVSIGCLITGGLLSAPTLSFWLQETLPIYLGPVLALMGLIVLGYIPFFSLGKKPGDQTARKLIGNMGVWGALILGFLFALAICPPSAAILFGGAIPLSLQSGSESVWLGISLFGLGTSIPVVFFALLLVLSVEKAHWALKRLPKIQTIMKYGTGWFFVALGLYWIFVKILLV